MLGLWSRSWWFSIQEPSALTIPMYSDLMASYFKYLGLCLGAFSGFGNELDLYMGTLKWWAVKRPRSSPRPVTDRNWWIIPQVSQPSGRITRRCALCSPPEVPSETEPQLLSAVISLTQFYWFYFCPCLTASFTIASWNYPSNPCLRDCFWGNPEWELEQWIWRLWQYVPSGTTLWRP